MPGSDTRRRWAASNNGELTIGQLSELADASRDTLRFYERRGLLEPTRRTPAGYRLFDRSAIDRLDFVRKAQALGLTLDQVGEVLRAAAEGTVPCEHVRATLEVHLRRVDARLRDLNALRSTLVDALQRSPETALQEACICGIIESREVPSRGSSRRRKEDK